MLTTFSTWYSVCACQIKVLDKPTKQQDLRTNTSKLLCPEEHNSRVVSYLQKRCHQCSKYIFWNAFRESPQIIQESWAHYFIITPCLNQKYLACFFLLDFKWLLAILINFKIHFQQCCHYWEYFKDYTIYFGNNFKWQFQIFCKKRMKIFQKDPLLSKNVRWLRLQWNR